MRKQQKINKALEGLAQLSITETKIVVSFHSAQFALQGYHSPHRLDIVTGVVWYTRLRKIINSFSSALM